MNRTVKICLSVMTIVVMLLASCNDQVTQADSEEQNIGSNTKISECGGFQSKHKQTRTEDEYCSAERLIWSYNQDAHTVLFLNQDVWLNCCGEHTMSIVFNEDTEVYEIHETDKPVSGKGRCLCLCFFDFQIELPQIPSGVISVQLHRHVTDEGPQQLIWQGALDLSQGNGDVVIQEEVGWCQ